MKKRTSFIKILCFAVILHLVSSVSASSRELIVVLDVSSGMAQTSLDSGKSWERIYFASDGAARQCLSVLQYGDWIYLGTKKGLFYKKAWEARWIQVKENLNDDPVYQIAGDENFLYLATDQSVFRLEKETRKLLKIYSAGIGR